MRGRQSLIIDTGKYDVVIRKFLIEKWFNSQKDLAWAIGISEQSMSAYKKLGRIEIKIVNEMRRIGIPTNEFVLNE